MFQITSLLRRPVLRRFTLSLIRLAGALSPRLALRLASRVFLVPSRRAARPFEREILRNGAREWIEFEGRRIALWRWGAGPVVFLAHGWAGCGGQLAGFVEPLVSAGFSVLAWDAPAHGDSQGRRTSLVEFAALIAGLARREVSVHAVIGHSLGAAAATLACADGAPIERVVFVSGAADPRSFFRWFLGVLGFSDPRRAAAMIEIERMHGFRWDDTNVAVRAAGLGRVGALVIHDTSDADVPFANGVRVAEAWPGARLLLTAGLGHRRILRDPSVIAEAVRFLLEGSGRVYRTESEVVEAQLWNRSGRFAVAGRLVVLAALLAGAARSAAAAGWRDSDVPPGVRVGSMAAPGRQGLRQQDSRVALDSVSGMRRSRRRGSSGPGC